MKHVIETPDRRIDINFLNDNMEITFTNIEAGGVISVELDNQELGTLIPILESYHRELSQMAQLEAMSRFNVNLEK